MKIIFDYRVLTHKTFTGVENYTKNILENIQDKCSLNIAKPKSTNKYLAHLWTHFVLPFKKGKILFCPANIAPLFIPRSKKLIVTIHDVSFLTYPQSFSKFFRIYYKFIIPIVIKRADVIITVSRYSQKEIEYYYPSAVKKTRVVYLGVDTSFYSKKEQNKKDQILYVGSMNARKNFIGVLKAFELLNDKKYKLLMVGNFSSNFMIDEQNQKILDASKNNPNIEFIQNTSNEKLVELYQDSKLFLFPSLYEGFGLPVLEAMACGTPVVCSHSSSLPEVGGDAVVYCDPNNIDNIQEKIKLVLENDNLQKNMIEKGLQRAKEFSWNKSAKKHIELFSYNHYS